MTDSGLSIIVPVYNEYEGLRQTVSEMEIFLDRGNIEIIIVNDGSDEKTTSILSGLDRDGVAVINHPVNRGYGAALKTGLDKAYYDYVGITDADGTYPNERFPEFYHAAKENDFDMVVGARQGKTVYIPWIRKFPKWCIGRLADYVSRSHIPDLNSGMRVMRKESVEKYLSILPDGFSFTSTITLAMTVNNHAVNFVNIDYHKRKGKSKIRPIHDTLNFIQLILRTTIYFDPLRVFVPFGFFLFLAAGIAAFLGATFLDRIPDVTVAILALGGIQVVCLGLVADQINRKFSSR
tara:strand:+ start:5917 stop:6795 length:879 start_codon:yes stop_codon:yes gene_type:complete